MGGREMLNIIDNNHLKTNKVIKNAFLYRCIIYTEENNNDSYDFLPVDEKILELSYSLNQSTLIKTEYLLRKKLNYKKVKILNYVRCEE